MPVKNWRYILLFAHSNKDNGERAMQSHQEIIKLIISYTLVGAFVFTVLITLASLVGWVRFQDHKQQKKLFNVLIVQLIIGCVAFFMDYLSLNPQKTFEAVEAEVSTIRILDAANTKAMSTKSDSEIRLSAMFDSIDDSIDAANREVNKLPNGKTKYLSLDIIKLMQEIAKAENKIVTKDFGNRASGSEIAVLQEIDNYKLQILTKADELADIVNYQSEIPKELGFGFIDDTKTASMLPKSSEEIRL